MIQHATRLAPSPTGAMHLGNARTFLLNYLLARTRGWTILLRVEDLDGPRVKTGAAAELLTDLHWLGLEWDDRQADQSQRADAYRLALARLVAAGRAYPCTCTRTDIERAGSAPHADDAPTVYPGTCRGRWANEQDAVAQTARRPAYRIAVEDTIIEFEDMFAGPRRIDLTAIGGDFVIYKSDGMAAYQLAVVIDDEEGGVTDVVRADDLLESAGRQILIRQLLGLPASPRYWHLPLVIGEDGRRLAKRHGDTRLSHYRGRRRVTAHRVLGLLGYWSGLLGQRRATDLPELLERFDITKVPDAPIVFGAQDEDYLLGR